MIIAEAYMSRALAAAHSDVLSRRLTAILRHRMRARELRANQGGRRDVAEWLRAACASALLPSWTGRAAAPDANQKH
jgi:hypothetical protein